MPFRFDLRLRRLLPIGVATFIAAVAGAHTAAAQTVIVQSAPSGSTIEANVNNGAPVSAPADSRGDATLTVATDTSERAVLLFVDACGTAVRVHIVTQGLQPDAAEAGCVRTDVRSTFVLRPSTTFVIDMAGTNPIIHIAQGPPPSDWVHGGVRTRGEGEIPWGRPKNGLVLSAGVGFSGFSSIVDTMCGDAATCSSNNIAIAATLSAEYWVSKYAAAYVSYTRPADVTTNGGDTANTYQFSSNLKSRFVIIGGKGGVTTGPLRIYGMAGANRHESTWTTLQMLKDSSVVVDGVTQAVPGGTQSYAQKFTGWGWSAGGGIETWVGNWIAIYGEATMSKLSGKPINGGEGVINDKAIVAVIGVRVGLGGPSR